MLYQNKSERDGGENQQNQSRIVDLSNQIKKIVDDKTELAELQQTNILDIEKVKDKIVECFLVLWTEQNGKSRLKLLWNELKGVERGLDASKVEGLEDSKVLSNAYVAYVEYISEAVGGFHPIGVTAQSKFSFASAPEVKALWSNIMSPRDRWREEKMNELREKVVVQYEDEARLANSEEHRMEKAKQAMKELERDRRKCITVYRAAYGALLNDFNDTPTMVKRDLAHLALALDVLVQTSGREGTAWLMQLLADCAALSMSNDNTTAATLSSVAKTMDTIFPFTKLQSALTSWLRGLKAMARTTGYYPPAIPGTDTRLVLLKCLRLVDTIVTLELCATESSRKDVPKVQASSSPAAKLSLTLLLDGLYFELRTKKAGDTAFPGLSSPCFGACEFAPTQWKDGVDEKDSVDLESWLAGVCSTTLSSLVVRFVGHESLGHASLELLKTIVSGAAPLSQCKVAPALDLGLCALPRAAIAEAYCLLQRMKDYDSKIRTTHRCLLLKV